MANAFVTEKLRTDRVDGHVVCSVYVYTYAFFVLLILLSTSAQAANPLEMLLMPGKLTLSHAQFEDNCDICHESLNKEKQNHLCLDCHDHKNIAVDINNSTGFHGRSALVNNAQCNDCHTDHEGRSFDIVRLDSDSFIHDDTDFRLSGEHQIAQCSSCHKPDKGFLVDEFECVSCHKSDDKHQGEFGAECETCHTDKGWQKTKYDHAAETGFALNGEHSDLQCELCHVTSSYDNTPTDCVSCHLINDEHKGVFGGACSDCHSEKGWEETLFDHNSDTDYKLTGKHQDLSCSTCHSRPVQSIEHSRQQCADCHLSDDVHNGTNGSECESCHGTDKWQTVDFDHDIDTQFALRGSHSKLDCATCHSEGDENALAQSTSNCYSCHLNDDVHQGALGRQCLSCHNETDWVADVAFNHDLSAFPLIGQHDIVACGECHLDDRYAFTQQECAVCHDADDEHEGALGDNCEECHNPNGWEFWRFNHELSTDFPLEGAHEGLACVLCHSKPIADGHSTDQTCSSCHRQDDKHRGRFGDQCERCHVQSSFDQLKFRR